MAELGRRVVIGERTLTAGLLVVVSVGPDILQRENPLPGFIQRARVDVRGIDEERSSRPSSRSRIAIE